MNTLPAQELKRRGIAAVEAMISSGDVHVIRNNRPEYVVLSEERYRELVAEAEEGYQARVKAALLDVAAGRTTKGTATDLISELGLDN